MYDLFAKILDMSVMGSIVILVTILMRFVLRKRSKKYVMALWAIVALRLLVPVSFESALSVFNYIPHKVFVAEKASDVVKVNEVSIAAPAMAMPVKEEVTLEHDVVVMPEVREVAERPAVSINYRLVAAGIWGVGAVAVIGYCVTRFVMLKRSLKDATKIENNIYESDKVDMPFVFGLVEPKIFLPEVLESDEREYILMHEKTHIKYGDWISKMVGMAAVAIHWFNPIVLLGFALFEQDLEMRCDENTVIGMDRDLRMAYTMSIVNHARKCDRVYLVAPLSFSRPNFCKREVTSRVKNIINYKKGTKFTAIITTMLIFAVSTACALDSKSGMNKIFGEDKNAGKAYEETSVDMVETESSAAGKSEFKSVYDMSAKELAFYTHEIAGDEFEAFLNSLDEDELIEYMDKVDSFNIKEDPEYQAMVLEETYSSLMAKAKEEHEKDTKGTLLFAFSDNSCDKGIIIYDSATDSYETYYYDEADETIKWKETLFIHIDPTFLAAEEWMKTYDEFVNVKKISDFELDYALREPSWKYVNYLG